MKRKWFPGMLDFINIRVENPTLRKIVLHAPSARRGFKLLAAVNKIANMPLIRSFHPWAQNEHTKMYVIPVDKTLEAPGDVELPYKIVEDMIDKSTHRVIMDFCGCRMGYECENYPTELGCLMMGEDSKKIPKAWSRPVSKQEARDHLHKVVEAGLVPFIGKARIDNFIFGIPDNGKLLTVCFCCECCCIGRLITPQIPAKDRNMQFNRLIGLDVWVDRDRCEGCGTCTDKCFLNLIEVRDEKASIPSNCRGCGRCVKYCPNEAIRMRLNNPDYIDHAIRNIESFVKP